MGLLYPFPVSTEETDFVQITHAPTGRIGRVELKSYGLPYIFWAYAAASLTVIFFLWLAVREPMSKLGAMGGIDALLVYALQVLIYSLPVIMLGFFFYEKRLIATPGQLVIKHRLFFLPIKSSQHQLCDVLFSIDHFMDAPNVARLQGTEDSRGFQNKGYFTLWAITEKGPLQIDRHSRKVDLEASMALLKLAATP
jgi:hypothetical protein